MSVPALSVSAAHGHGWHDIRLYVVKQKCTTLSSNLSFGVLSLELLIKKYICTMTTKRIFDNKTMKYQSK